MKKILSAIMVCTVSVCLTAQTINISTGIALSADKPVSETADNWTVNSGKAYTAISPGNNHKQDWFIGCAAKWIRPVSSGGKPIPGDYTYEKIIPVPVETAIIAFDFRVAYYDVLKSVELISPDSIVTPLSWTAVRIQHRTRPVVYSLPYPKAGNWVLRVKVLHNSAKAGLLLCGTADIKKTEGCLVQDPECNPAFTTAPFTINAQGFVEVNTTPAVNEGAVHYWGAMTATDISDSVPIRLATILEGRCFGLGISSSGIAVPLGKDSSITSNRPGYGFQYAKVAPGICFKITHYIRCCSRWYSQTNVYCTRLCTDTKALEPGAVTAPHIPRQLRTVKE
jgi:hypothetical protein